MLLSDSRDADGTWADSADPHRRWAMPAGLDVRRATDGDPRFLLARWADRSTGARGGLLQLELDALPPSQPDAVAVPFMAARSRLALRAVETAVITALGEWRELPPNGDPLVTLVETLEPDVLQLVEEGVESDASVVEVVVEGIARAVTSGLPVLVVLRPEDLAGLVGEDGATVAEIAVALHSLPTDAVTLVGLDGGDGPGRDEILEEVAHRLAGHLAADPSDAWSPRHYRLPADPATVPHAYDLRTVRPATVRFTGGWSVSGLARSLSPEQRAALFPRLDAASPFGVTRYVVVNAVPVDAAAGVRSVQVDVVTTGTAGLPEQRSFLFEGEHSTDRFDAVHPAWLGDPAPPRARAHAVLAALPGTEPAWPRRLPARPVDVTGTLVTVTPEQLGIQVVTVTVEPDALALADELVVTVLVDAAPVARAVVTSPLPLHLAYDGSGDATLTVTADGVEVKAQELTGSAVLVSVVASDFVDLEPELLTVTLAPGEQAAFVAITLEDALATTRTLTLEPDAPQTWAYHRRSKTAALRYRWQLHWVPVAEDGGTRPLASTAWAESDQAELVVSVPRQEEP